MSSDSKQRVLVTGAGGFLGSHICRHFQQKGDFVSALGRFHLSAEDARNLRLAHEFHGLTLPDPGLPQILRQTRPHLIVHCAGTASVGPSLGQPHVDFQRNVEVCAALLESIRHEIPEKILGY